MKNMFALLKRLHQVLGGVDRGWVRANAPLGCVIYAIGDIHGCREALEALHQRIADDAATRAARFVHLVYLGDYVDRGPDSRGVIDALLAPPPVPGAQQTCLLGNHEAAMLAFLADPEQAAPWLEHGGLETLASYGVRVQSPGPGWRQDLALALRQRLPATHLAFLRGLRRRVEIGDYAFVHAGIRPGLPLDAQDPDDLLWIREPFLSSRHRHEKVIVHGHTPGDHVVFAGNRIGVDTGAYLGGGLSCAVLYADRQDSLTAGEEPGL